MIHLSSQYFNIKNEYSLLEFCKGYRLEVTYLTYNLLMIEGLVDESFNKEDFNIKLFNFIDFDKYKTNHIVYLLKNKDLEYRAKVTLYKNGTYQKKEYKNDSSI